jgi:hypothetical protein
VFDIAGTASIIIRAAFLPPGKMIIFITMRIAAAICPRAIPSELKMGTLHQPFPFGASSGSFFASKPGLFLASAEAATSIFLWSDASLWIYLPETEGIVENEYIARLRVRGLAGRLRLVSIRTERIESRQPRDCNHSRLKVESNDCSTEHP